VVRGLRLRGTLKYPFLGDGALDAVRSEAVPKVAFEAVNKSWEIGKL
jgi:hypothetical protein